MVAHGKHQVEVVEAVAVMSGITTSYGEVPNQVYLLDRVLNKVAVLRVACLPVPKPSKDWQLIREL